VTTGDNNYLDGEAATIDANIGQFYHGYIAPYAGGYGAGAPGGVNRFFPSLGNHDYVTTHAQPYLHYFTLPHGPDPDRPERYYDFVWGPLHWFVLDANPLVTGEEMTATQAAWLQTGLANSTAPWQLVVMHQQPYSSGSLHGDHESLQWPYADWGAEAVFAGHGHHYERLAIDGMVYFVNGSGGAPLVGLGPGEDPRPGSQVLYAEKHGAMLVEASAWQVTFQFITHDGQVIDSYQIGQAPPPGTATLPPRLWLPFIDR
jgi:hypothetical protein